MVVTNIFPSLEDYSCLRECLDSRICHPDWYHSMVFPAMTLPSLCSLRSLPSHLSRFSFMVETRDSRLEAREEYPLMKSWKRVGLSF